MIHQIVYILRFELMQNRHRHRSVCHCGKETYSPIGLIASTKSNFIPPFKPALRERNVQIFYSLRHFFIFERTALIIRQSLTLPVVLEAIFKSFIYRFEFHISIPLLSQAMHLPSENNEHLIFLDGHFSKPLFSIS